MTSSQRISLNAIVTYLRSLLGAVLGLFSSRWVLQGLGSQDFGIYNVVGSLIAFVVFFNIISSGAVARFFAYSIGKNNPTETAEWFNTALLIHTAVPLILIIIGWPAGEWAIKNFLNIPFERLNTSVWVFRFSLLAAFVNIAATPYIGMHTARQKIAELSLWNMVVVIGAFILAFGVTRYKGDTLLLYAGGMVVINIAVKVIQIVRARLMFLECRFNLKLVWSLTRIKEILSFAGWQIVGGVGSILRGQGTAILLNKYFQLSLYPHVNAAYGIGNQLSAQTQTLSVALLSAFSPEIITAEGRGDRQRVLSYAMRASKYATFLVLLFVIPLYIEMNSVIKLWLKEPPLLTAEFCRMMLIVLVFEKLSSGYVAAVMAKGKIALYQIVVGGFILLTLPLAWFCLYFGGSAVSVMWAFLVTTSLCTLGRVAMSRYLLGASIKKWLQQVLAPCLLISAISFLVGYGVQGVVTISLWQRLILVTALTLIVSLSLAYIFILDDAEKAFLQKTVKIRLNGKVRK